MKLKSGLGGKALAVLLTVGIVTAAYAQARLSLRINGAVASSDVRIIGGQPYVPLSDVARAYHQTLVKRGGGYEIVAAGGAGEVGDNHTASIGEELFTGKWRFKVLTVTQADHYTLINDPGGDPDIKEINPSGANDTLVVVNCRIKNGMTAKHSIGVGIGDYNGDTALTDDQEHAYQPVAYDLHHDKKYYDAYGAALLPGAVEDMALIFSVPKGTSPKSLVFSIMMFDDIYMDTKHHTDVRISLAS